MAFLKQQFGWALILLLLEFAQTSHASEGLQLQEQEIKAGLLYNFLKYTDWPANAAPSPLIVVCVFGDDPFEGALKPMAGRTVNQREIAVRSLHTVQDASGCQLIFVNEGEKERWPQLLTFLAGKSVLTVSDFSGFAASGGMIEFSHQDNHVSAELNMDALTAAQLHVQDRMLRLVTTVHSGR